MAERLAELDGLLEEKEELTKLEARLAEREQLVELKTHELKTDDEKRAAKAAELKEKLDQIAKREKELAKAEARVSAAGRARQKRARRSSCAHSKSARKRRG